VDDGDSTDAQYCGYAWLRLECRRDEPVLQLPSGDYAIAEIHYGERTMRLDDVAVNSTACPHVAGRTLALPPQLSLTASNVNITFLLGCDFVGVAARHVIPCLRDGRKNSYVFRDGEVPSEYGSLCDEVVALPVINSSLDDVAAALKTGFQLSWRPDGGECAVCESSGGKCGLSRNTFACFSTPAAAKKEGAGQNCEYFRISSRII
jgi:hypothetical protein